MQKIPITRAQAGMILAKDVRRIDCQSAPPLCGKGTELTMPLISKLQDLGTISVIVEGHPIWMEGDLTLEEMLNSLEKRFAKSDQDPLMAKLKAIYQHQLVESMKGPDA